MTPSPIDSQPLMSL